MTDRSLVTCTMFSLLLAAGCNSEDEPGPSSDESPASEQQTADRATDAVLRLASLTQGTPTAGASFDGLEDANDALGDFNAALRDAACAAVSVTAQGDAVVELADCTLEGSLGIDGTLTITSDATIDCTDPLDCLFEATVSVDADIVIDDIAITGSWTAAVNQDGEGSVSGAFTATAGEFTVDVGLDVSFGGDGSCQSSVDYTDSNGNVVDIDAACYQ